MLQSPTQTVPHTHIVSTLSRLRQEWQQATDGGSLLETSGNIGLVLADLINGLGLNVDDQREVLGNELFQELNNFLCAPKQN